MTKDCKDIHRNIKDELDYHRGWSQTENRALYFVWGIVTALTLVWILT